MKWNHELECAVTAARDAGNWLYAQSRDQIKIVNDAGRDLKLAADTESERRIIDVLGTRFPGYGIISEEAGYCRSHDDDTPCWIVDPIDGSVNFSRGIPLWTVSIALWLREQPLLGVIYIPANKELFQGIVGRGATCNGTPVAVSSVQKKSDATLATGFPLNRDFTQSALSRFVGRIQTFKKIRMFGAASLSLAYLACGRVDAYIEEDIMLWDIAAGVAIVRAAGGFVTIETSETAPLSRNVLCLACDELKQ